MENIREPVRRRYQTKTMKQYLGYTKIQKTFSTENVSIYDLLRCLPFQEKERTHLIRKKAIQATLKEIGISFKASSNIQTLMELLKIHYSYDEHLNKMINAFITFQQQFQKCKRTKLQRCQGPGIPLSKCQNQECPYTMEELSDLPINEIITWEDERIYGCHHNAIYNLLATHFGNNDELEMAELDKYEDKIDQYEKSLSSSRRRYCYWKKYFINPFTRHSFQPEFLRRVIQMGIERNMLKPLRAPPSPSPPAPRYGNRREDIDITVNAQTISQQLQQLEFFTPDNVMYSMIEPNIVFTTYEQRNLPGPIYLTNSLRLVEYIRWHIAPFLESMAVHFTNPVIRSVLNGRERAFSRMYRSRRTIEQLYRQIRTIHNMVSEHEGFQPLIQRIKQLNTETFQLLSHIFNILARILNADEETIHEEERRSVAILIIISLVQSGQLGDGFEWATLD